MKSLITSIGTFGPFASVATLDDRYQCDGTDYPFAVVGAATTGVFVPPTPAQIPATVPQSISMLDARLTMIGAGWMAGVKSYLAAIPGIDGEQAREYFEYALTMRRDHPLVRGIPAALGKTEAEVDALFIAAGALNA